MTSPGSNTPSVPEALRASAMIESEFQPLWDDVEDLLNDYHEALVETSRNLEMCDIAYRSLAEPGIR